jgi:carbon monoxide dehydrogenase subunit G
MERMELTNTFTVAADPQVSWDFFLSPEKVIPCIPGTEYDGLGPNGEWKAKAKVKLGPVSMSYKGKVSILEQDDDNLRVVMKGSGTETRGKGMVKADIISELTRTDDGGTSVVVKSTLKITGRAAQFGRGMISDVADKFTREFAEQMEHELAKEAGEAASKEAEEATKAAEEALKAAEEAARAAEEDDADDTPGGSAPETTSEAKAEEAARTATAAADPDMVASIEALIARAEKAAKAAEKAAKKAAAASAKAEASAAKADAAAKRTEAALAKIELAHSAPEKKELNGLAIAWLAIKSFFSRLFGGGRPDEPRRLDSGS